MARYWVGSRNGAKTREKAREEEGVRRRLGRLNDKKVSAHNEEPDGREEKS